MGRTATLRARITATLVGTATVSVLLLAAVTFVVVQQVLDSRAEGQLAAMRDDRTTALELTVDQLEATTSAIAAEPGVVTAFAALLEAWPSLGPPLDAAERTGLETALDGDVPELPAGLDPVRPSAPDLVADSVAGQRAQYLTIAENPEPRGERALLDDPGGGSEWSAAHAVHHPFLRELLGASRASDMLFVAADTHEVVYSVAKHADLGTDVRDGPWSDSGLAEVVATLPQLSVTDTAVADSRFHPPAGLTPTLFMGSTVRDGSQVLGALVLEVPIAGLTDFVTADGQFDQLGLGATGQVYVVGGDGTLRTEPRGWREDPGDYLQRLADLGSDGAELAALVEAAGSPVQVQPVATDAVTAADDGEDVVVRGDGLLGGSTLAAARPVGAAGLDWVLVTEQSQAESSASVGRFLVVLGLLLAVLVPLILLVGFLVARSMTRPHGPVIAASAQLATGDTDIDLPDLGTNELGDLARQLEGVAEDLRERRSIIVDEDRRIEELLSAVVPPRLMESVRAGERGVADVLDTATVAVVSFVAAPEANQTDDDLLVAFTDRATRAVERLAAEHGLEPVTVANHQERFLAGHGQPGTEAEAAARFATAVSEAVRAAAREHGLVVDARVGMAAGPVGTGIVGSSQPSFAVWGDPPGVAATLDGLARPGEVLVDATLARELAATWLLEPLEGAVGLDDEPIDAWTLRSPGDPQPDDAAQDAVAT